MNYRADRVEIDLNSRIGSGINITDCVETKDFIDGDMVVIYTVSLTEIWDKYDQISVQNILTSPDVFVATEGIWLHMWNISRPFVFEGLLSTEQGCSGALYVLPEYMSTARQMLLVTYDCED